MNLDCYRNDTVFPVSSSRKTKTIFSITREDKFGSKKRKQPFVIQKAKSVNMLENKGATRAEEANQKSNAMGEQLFEFKKNYGGLIITENDKEECKMQEECNKLEEANEKALTVTQANLVEQKLAAIFNELHSISQELAYDYLPCKAFASLNPVILNYWINLRDNIFTLHQITKNIAFIPKNTVILNN